MQVKEVMHGSHVGLKRKENQDTYCVVRELGLFAVADGMGGRPQGKRASTLAIEYLTLSIRRNYVLLGNASTMEAMPILSNIVQEVNTQMRAFSFANPECLGFGTTLVFLVLCKNGAVLVNIGDSKAFFLSQTPLHSPASLVSDSPRVMVENGKKIHYVNGLGIWDQVAHLEISPIFLPSGAVLMLCSDGLSDYFNAESLQQLQFLSSNVAELFQRVTSEVLARGAHDNLTGILIQFA